MIVLTGQKSVTTAGTAVQVTTAGLVGPGTYLFKALAANTSYVYVGNTTGTVTSASGYQLTSATEQIVCTVTDLSQVYLNSVTDGQGICWIRVEGQNIGAAAPAA